MENSKELKIKHSMPVEELAAYLKDISDTLAKGQTCIQYDAKFITLHPAKEIEVKIQAEQKKGKERLSLEMSWQSAEESAKPNGFKISASEPDPAETEEEPEASEEPRATKERTEEKAEKPKAKKAKKPAAKTEKAAAAT